MLLSSWAREIDQSAADALLYDGDLTTEGDLDTGDWGDSQDRETEGAFLVVRVPQRVRRRVKPTQRISSGGLGPNRVLA